MSGRGPFAWLGSFSLSFLMVSNKKRYCSHVAREMIGRWIPLGLRLLCRPVMYFVWGRDHTPGNGLSQRFCHQPFCWPLWHNGQRFRVSLDYYEPQPSNVARAWDSQASSLTKETQCAWSLESHSTRCEPTSFRRSSAGQSRHKLRHKKRPLTAAFLANYRFNW